MPLAPYNDHLFWSGRFIVPLKWIWLWVYHNTIPIYPTFYLLKGDYRFDNQKVVVPDSGTKEILYLLEQRGRIYSQILLLTINLFEVPGKGTPTFWHPPIQDDRTAVTPQIQGKVEILHRV